MGYSVYGKLKNRVVISDDVVNNNATPDTLQDITGLSFPVTANKKYWFRFFIPFTAASSSTGSRWAVNGPALTTLYAYSRSPLSATSFTQRLDTGYDGGAISATSVGTGNVAIIEGFVECSAAGTVIGRFSSEVAGSAITAKAGSYVEYLQLN